MAKKHDEINVLADDAGLPYNAVTNKKTMLLVLGGTSVPLPKGQALVVIGEDSNFGSVNTSVNGGYASGLVARPDYDAA